MRQIISVAAVANLSTTSVVYAALAQAPAWDSDDTRASHSWSVAGTFSQLVVRVRTAPGVGKSHTFVLRINGVDTAVTCAITDAATTARDTTHSVTIAPGDRVSIKNTPSGTPAAGGTVTLSVEFNSTATGESGYARLPVQPVIGAAGTRYAAPFSLSAWHTTAAEVIDTIPLAGTLTRLDLQAGPWPFPIQGGCSDAVTLYLNGVKQDGSGGTANTTATLTAGNSVASSTFSLAVVPGDTVYLECVKVGSGFESVGWSLRLAATTDGESIVAGGGDDPLHTTTTKYQAPGWPGGDAVQWQVTEADLAADGAVNVLILSRLYVRLQGAPGTGTSDTLSMRVNGASPGGTLSVTIANSATTGNDTTGVNTVNDGDVFVMRCVPAGTPTTRAVRWAMVQGPGQIGGDSTITFGPPTISGSGSTDATTGAFTIGVLVELLLNGVWTDVTADVLTREPIVAFSGRRMAGPTSVVPEPGTMTFTLNNSVTNSGGVHAYYSPYHTNCRSGFGLRTGVRLTLASPASPVTAGGTVVWVGRIVSLAVDPGEHRERGVRVSAMDVIGNLGESPCPPLAFAINQQAHYLVNTLLTALADPDIVSGVYTVDIDNTATPAFAAAFDSIPDTASALEELNRIVMSERGRLYTGLGGVLVFRSRGLVADPVSAWLRDTMSDLQLRTTSDDLAQRVEVTLHPTTFGETNDVVLWQLTGTPPFLPAGTITDGLFGPFRDATATNSGTALIGGTDFQAVTAVTDYEMNDHADGEGDDLTADLVVTAHTTAKGVQWTLQNVGTQGGHVLRLQLRGRPIYRTTVKVVALTNTTYGARIVAFDLPYESDLVRAQQVADDEAALFARPGQARAASVTFPASRSAAHVALLFLEQGSRIALSEALTGLSLAEDRIVGQKWEVTPPRHCAITLYLEALEMAGWTTPAFGAATYFGTDENGDAEGTWTVGSGDVTSHRYVMANRTMTFTFIVSLSSVSGAPRYLTIEIPEGRVANMYAQTPIMAVDNSTPCLAYVQANEAGGALLIGRTDGADWATSTNATTVAGQITFETTT